MIDPPNESARPRREAKDGHKSNRYRQDAISSGENQGRDVFEEARQRYTIPELWPMLRLPGEVPRLGAKFSSPFRPDAHPSCDISRDGRWFADRSRGDNFDAVAFVREAINGDWQEVRLWFMERLGIDRQEMPARRDEPAAPEKSIVWPGPLIKGTKATWVAFAERAGIPFAAACAAVQAGFIRFVKVEGRSCYVITDEARRAAEIRRFDGKLFGTSKAFPLRGVDKRWLPGVAGLREAGTASGLFLTEGASDWLAGWGLYVRYRRDFQGVNSWRVAAVLGASCRTLHPELVPTLRGRRVRIVPDGDKAGDAMALHWRRMLLELGCRVEVVKLPRGRDLRDVAGEIEPEGLFA